jgi:Cu+-exporting ATPase
LGSPSVVDSKVFSTEDLPFSTISEFWNLVAAVESNSSHPLAKAVLSFVKELNEDDVSTMFTVAEITETGGKGLSALVTFQDSTTFAIYIGNETWLLENGCADSLDSFQPVLSDWKNRGTSTVMIAMKKVVLSPTSESPRCLSTSNSQLVGLLSIADQVRPEASTVVKRLQARGIEVFKLFIAGMDDNRRS